MDFKGQFQNQAKTGKNNPFASTQITQILKGQSGSKSNSNKNIKGFNMKQLSVTSHSTSSKTNNATTIPSNNPPSHFEEELGQLKRELSQKNKEIEDLKHRVEEEKERSYQEGKTQGKQEAELSYQQEYQSALEELQKNCAETMEILSKEKDSIFKELEHLVPYLIQKGIQKIIGSSLNHLESPLLHIVKKSVEAMGKRHSLKVTVATGSTTLLKDNTSFWLPIGHQMENVQLEEDDSLEKGSCIVECGGATAEVHLKEILRDMEEQLENVFRNLTNTSSSQSELENISDNNDIIQSSVDDSENVEEPSPLKNDLNSSSESEVSTEQSSLDSTPKEELLDDSSIEVPDDPSFFDLNNLPIMKDDAQNEDR